MIRVSVSYPAQEGQTFDHAYYQQQHRRLIEELMKDHGLQRVEMDQCLASGNGGPPANVAVAHMIFATLEGFQQGIAKNGRALMGDIPNYTKIAPDIQISEMK